MRPEIEYQNPCTESKYRLIRAIPFLDRRRVGDLLGYARVSTVDQTMASHLDALNDAGCHRVFQEHASGASDRRVELANLFDHVRPGDTVVVWRLDRLGRSLRHLIDTVTALADRQVGFRSLVENIDTTTSGGKLVFHIFGALAEFERELISERTHAGLSAARARGRVGGRPSALTPTQAVEACRMYESGEYTWEQIGEMFGLSRVTVYRHVVKHPEDNPSGGDTAG